MYSSLQELISIILNLKKQQGVNKKKPKVNVKTPKRKRSFDFSKYLPSNLHTYPKTYYVPVLMS